MSTLSTNIAGTVRPFVAGVHRRVWPYGMVPISALKKKRKKKCDNCSMVSLEDLTEKWNEKIGDDLWNVTPPDKEGKWRRAGGHNVFFPDDGSAPVGMSKNLRGKGIGAKKGSESGGKIKMILASLRKTLAKIRELKGSKKKLSKAQKKAIGQEGTVKGMMKALAKSPPDMAGFTKLQKAMGKKIG